ncbi:hypothetical protein HZS_6698 [Henneguya salminicola]|nr:hypothetical protein HZS_6698 [Henneguya salminicola]
MQSSFMEWCEKFNMSLNEKKSALLHVVKAGPVCKEFCFCDKIIPLIEREQVYKYLGVKVGLCFDTYNDQVVELMSAAIEALKKVSNAKIPPYIKLSLTKSFILPKLDHVYRLKDINKELLEKFDAQIREHVKNFMNLPLTTNSAFFHSPCWKGGLGLREFGIDGVFSDIRRFLLCLNDKSLLGLFSREKLIKSRKSVGEEAPANRSNAELLNLPSASCKHLGHLSKSIKRVKDLGVEFITCELDNFTTLLKLPYTSRSKSTVSSLEWKIIRDFLSEKSFSKFTNMSLQGATAKCVSQNASSNAFITKGNLPIDVYSWCFLARLDLLPTKSSLKIRQIINPGGENSLKCKLCGAEEETLSHILNGCAVNKHLQTTRHDAVIKKLILGSNLPSSSNVRINKAYPFAGQSRPDIIILNNKGDKDYLLEVSCAFDNIKNYLESFKIKKEKYALLTNVHKEKTGRDLTIVPVIIGSLGSVPTNVSEIAEALNISLFKAKQLLEKIATNTIIKSKSIYDSYVAG